MKDFPLVSLVLLNYNGFSYLGKLFTECLDSLFETDYSNFEVIFVDNNSSDSSVNYFKDYLKNIKLSKNTIRTEIIENKQNIIGMGYNEGMKISKGKYVALLSNDMVYEPNWLKKIITAMENNPKIGVAGCKRLIYGTKNIVDGLGGNLSIDGRANIPGHLETDSGQYREIISTDWVGGAAVIKRDVLVISGLFDLGYNIFYEDTDLCFRIRRKGFKIVCVPEAVLWHKATTTIDSTFSTTVSNYLGEHSRVRFAFIHFNITRLTSTLLIDWLSIVLVNSYWKKILMRAYYSNFKNIGVTLKRRLEYGIPPHYSLEYPPMVLINQIITKLK